MRQQLIRPMMGGAARPPGGANGPSGPAFKPAQAQQQPPVRPQTRNNMAPRPSPATNNPIDDGDDDVVLDDDSNDEWLPSGATSAPPPPAAGGGLPSFANTWR